MHAAVVSPSPSLSPHLHASSDTRLLSSRRRRQNVAAVLPSSMHRVQGRAPQPRGILPLRQQRGLLVAVSLHAAVASPSTSLAPPHASTDRAAPSLTAAARKCRGCIAVAVKMSQGPRPPTTRRPPLAAATRLDRGRVAVAFPRTTLSALDHRSHITGRPQAFHNYRSAKIDRKQILKKYFSLCNPRRIKTMSLISVIF